VRLDDINLEPMIPDVLRSYTSLGTDKIGSRNLSSIKELIELSTFKGKTRLIIRPTA
jgi:hypothetical protein